MSTPRSVGQWMTTYGLYFAFVLFESALAFSASTKATLQAILAVILTRNVCSQLAIWVTAPASVLSHPSSGHLAALHDLGVCHLLWNTHCY